MKMRRFIAGLVIAAGIFSIAVGVQRWFDAQAAETVVDALMLAVKSGNQAAALPLLTPQLRQMVERPSRSPDRQQVWLEQAGVSYSIGDVVIDGDRAAATVQVDKDGFALKPIVHLLRSSTSRWKVDRVENLEIDPRYLQRRREFERHQGEALANRLQKALENRPGVKIERVSFTKETPPR